MNGADIMNPWIGAVPIGSLAAAATESGAGDASGGLGGNTYLSSCFSWILITLVASISLGQIKKIIGTNK